MTFLAARAFLGGGKKLFDERKWLFSSRK